MTDHRHRTVKDAELRFDRMIEWRRGGNIIEWCSRRTDPESGLAKDDIKEQAVFEAGTPDNNDICRLKLRGLVRAVEEREKQFELVKEVIVEELWVALVVP